MFRQFLIRLAGLLNRHEAIVRLDEGSQHPDTKRIEAINLLMCTAFLAFLSSSFKLLFYALPKRKISPSAESLLT